MSQAPSSSPSSAAIGTATGFVGVQRSDPVVVCQQLSKVFKDFWMRDRAKAVNTLSFEIRPREIFGLLGPNGSGKSTTIKMILGLLKPSSGRVAIFGKDPTDVAIKRRIGYLPEESYLYGFLNARETLDYYAKLFEIDLRTRQRRIDELLDMVGLTGAQFRPVREYSKGMQRRIGIAQALINDPDLLILDEPTTGLDPLGTRQVKDLILQLGRRGKTVLLSSHLLADVEDCVDRLVILYGGQKRAEGTCDDLLMTRTRTTLETDSLDDETVAEVDRVIRTRSSGTKSVLKVAAPRQSLEDLFLDIVDKARQEIATSGAMSGGPTASFLRGERAEGEELIANLMKAPEPIASTEVVKSAPADNVKPAGPDLSVVGDLVKPREAAPASSTTSAPPAVQTPSPNTKTPDAPASNVDLGMIGNLLGDQSGPTTPPSGGPRR